MAKQTSCPVIHTFQFTPTQILGTLTVIPLAPHTSLLTPHPFLWLPSHAPIAALTEKRLAVLPNLPTIKEQGIQMSIIANARGFLAPLAIAKEVVEFWENFFAGLTKTVSWKKYVDENRVEDVFLKSRELAPFFDEQITLMRSVLQEAGVKVER